MQHESTKTGAKRTRTVAKISKTKTKDEINNQY